MKVVILLVLIIFSGLGADYYGLLGTQQYEQIDYIGVDFSATDEDTGEKIIDVFVNCTKSGSQNACSTVQGWNKQVTEVKFGVNRIIERSWLFFQNETVAGEGEIDIHLMFIHPNYQRRTYTYSIGQLLSMTSKVNTIELKGSRE